MRNGKVITKAEREQNLFTFDLVSSRKAKAVISPPNNIKYCAMAMTKLERPIHLVSQSKYIRFWHR